MSKTNFKLFQMSMLFAIFLKKRDMIPRLLGDISMQHENNSTGENICNPKSLKQSNVFRIQSKNKPLRKWPKVTQVHWIHIQLFSKVV